MFVFSRICLSDSIRNRQDRARHLRLRRSCRWGPSLHRDWNLWPLLSTPPSEPSTGRQTSGSYQMCCVINIKLLQNNKISEWKLWRGHGAHLLLLVTAAPAVVILVTHCYAAFTFQVRWLHFNHVSDFKVEYLCFQAKKEGLVQAPDPFLQWISTFLQWFTRRWRILVSVLKLSYYVL